MAVPIYRWNLTGKHVLDQDASRWYHVRCPMLGLLVESLGTSSLQPLVCFFFNCMKLIMKGPFLIQKKKKKKVERVLHSTCWATRNFQIKITLASFKRMRARKEYRELYTATLSVQKHWHVATARRYLLQSLRFKRALKNRAATVIQAIFRDVCDLEHGLSFV